MIEVYSKEKIKNYMNTYRIIRNLSDSIIEIVQQSSLKHLESLRKRAYIIPNELRDQSFKDQLGRLEQAVDLSASYDLVFQ